MENNSTNKVMLQIRQLVLLAGLALLAPGLTAQQTAPITRATAEKVSSVFDDFSAEYAAFRYGRELGNATLSLSKLADNQYRLDYSSSVSLFFLSDKRKESSVFSLQDQQIIPQHYRFKRTGTGSDKQTRVEFNHEKNKIVVNDKPSFPLEEQLDNQLYRLDIQAKLALGESHFDYQVINYRGELRHYQLEVVASETLDLPYGKINTIKVGFIRENSSRQTYAWFAPELNYQLVRLQQFKDGEEQGDVRLKSYQPVSS